MAICGLRCNHRAGSERMYLLFITILAYLHRNQYLAFYHWVRNVFEADAVIHVGTHGSLEWLPGKGLVSALAVILKSASLVCQIFTRTGQPSLGKYTSKTA